MLLLVRNGGSLPSECPVDVEDLGHVLSQPRAVLDQDSHLLYLSQRSPIEVRASDIEMSSGKKMFGS